MEMVFEIGANVSVNVFFLQHQANNHRLLARHEPIQRSKWCCKKTPNVRRFQPFKCEKLLELVGQKKQLKDLASGCGRMVTGLF